MDMIREIKRRLEAIPQYKIHHNYMETNQEADALANHAANNSQQGAFQPHIWKYFVPYFLKQFVLNDA